MAGYPSTLGMGITNTKISIPILEVLDTEASSTFLKESTFRFL